MHVVITSRTLSEGLHLEDVESYIVTSSVIRGNGANLVEVNRPPHHRRVVAHNLIEGPYIVAGEVTEKSFGFTAHDAPEGAKLRISWFRNGSARQVVVDSLTWTSGNQTAWYAARAELISADGEVLAVSEVINP